MIARVAALPIPCPCMYINKKYNVNECRLAFCSHHAAKAAIVTLGLFVQCVLLAVQKGLAEKNGLENMH